MAKYVHDDVLDAALNYIANNGNKMVACSAQPTNYTEANSTYALADVAMTSGDYTIANGTTSGRKFTTAAKSAVTVDATGTITHIAIIDTVNSKLLFVTTTTSQAVTAGNTITIPAWKDEIADPA